MDLMLASVHHQDMEHLSNSQRIRAIAALAVTVFFWGAAFIAIRAVIVSDALSPGQLSSARLTLAAVALGAIVAVRGGVALPRGRDWLSFVVLGVIGQAAYHLLLNAGERTVDGGTASLLVQVAPMIAAVSAVVFLGERLTTAGWVGSAIAFAGACVITLAPGASGGSAQGLALVALSTLLWAAYLVIQKSIAHRYDPLALTAWPMWVGAVTLLPFSGGTVRALSIAPPSTYIALVALGLGSSVIGFMTWAY
ncbi:MAG: DMT family transporter, partial [Actinomycetota bacterium]|nr:DMT family transporter [Actinomycetota bacterium]